MSGEGQLEIDFETDPAWVQLGRVGGFATLDDAAVVKPTKGLGNFLSRFDANVIDGIVNGSATLTRVAAWISGLFDREVVDRMVNMVAEVVNSFSLVFRKLQTGLMQRYALFFVFGVVALLTFYLVGV